MSETETETSAFPERRFEGRKIIYTDYEEVTDDNIREVLDNSLSSHRLIAMECNYLYRYYKGIQPILGKVKSVRPEINNKVVRNHAQEIVNFKTGYLLNQDIEYVSKGGINADDITILNDYMQAEAKSSQDQRLVQDFEITGIGYRGIFPKKEDAIKGLSLDDDESPFDLYVLSPVNTFVVRTTAMGNDVVMAVNFVKREDGRYIYTCYTPTTIYTVDGVNIESEPNPIGDIPIIEYQLNEARMGAFEPVLSMLDAINRAESDRIDALDQTVQSLLLFHNVDIDEETFHKLREEGAVAYKDMSESMKGEVKYLKPEIDDDSSQTLVDNLYDAMLKIVGLPQRSGGGASTSDTGSAVVLRDGFYQAEVCARSTELSFKISERNLIRNALEICHWRANTLTSLRPSDVDVQFTRRNYENLQVKAQVLTTMLTCSDKSGNRMIDPSIAFESCGWFSDPDRKAKISQEFYDKQKKEADEKAKEIALGNFVNNGKAGQAKADQQAENGNQKDATNATKESDQQPPKPDK